MNKMVKTQRNLLYGRLLLFSVILIGLVILLIKFGKESDKELFYLLVFCGIIYVGFIVYTIYKIYQPDYKIVDEQKSIINGQINRYKKIIEDLEKQLKGYNN